MNISGRCDYACRAMLELAIRYETGTAVTSQTIAEQRGIPDKYLTHILLQLKRARLVRSMRGAQGGYTLQKPPEKISLLQIVEAIDGPVMYPKNTTSDDASEMRTFWQAVSRDFNEIMERITLRKMLDMTFKPTMFHI